MNKVALYARVSTKDKNQNPEVQLAELRKYCQDNNLEVIGEYVDQAGANDFVNRVAWSKLLKAAAARKFKQILVWKLDRAFRDIAMALNTVRTLRAAGIDFIVTTQPMLSVQGPAGDLMFNIYAAFAQFEKDTLVERVNAGIALAREQGKVFGRPARDVDVKKVLDACHLAGNSRGQWSRAADILTRETGQKISRGFVYCRVAKAAADQGCGIPDLFEKLSKIPPVKIGHSDDCGNTTPGDVKKEMVCDR